MSIKRDNEAIAQLYTEQLFKEFNYTGPDDIPDDQFQGDRGVNTPSEHDHGDSDNVVITDDNIDELISKSSNEDKGSVEPVVRVPVGGLSEDLDYAIDEIMSEYYEGENHYRIDSELVERWQSQGDSADAWKGNPYTRGSLAAYIWDMSLEKK